MSNSLVRHPEGMAHQTGAPRPARVGAEAATLGLDAAIRAAGGGGG